MSDEMNIDTTIGYVIESEDLNKLREIAEKLQGGSDENRDLGHIIWLIVNKAVPFSN